MISYIKSMSMKIRYANKDSKRNSALELELEYVSHDNRIPNPIKIKFPNSDEYIIVDAEYMREACSKVIEMRKI